jgi:hypothetical protein
VVGSGRCCRWFWGGYFAIYNLRVVVWGGLTHYRLCRTGVLVGVVPTTTYHNSSGIDSVVDFWYNEGMGNLLSDAEQVILARQLRLAVVTNLFDQGGLSREDAEEALRGPLTPGDESTIHDDSALLGDPDGLEKIGRTA